MRSALLAALTFAILGCSGWLPPVPRRAPDGSVEVTAPVDMRPLQVQPPMVLELGSEREERWLAIAASPRMDWIGSPEERSTQVPQYFLATFDDPEERTPRSRTVGGLPAYEREIIGVVEGNRVHSLHIVMAGEYSWFRIHATSSDARWAQNEPVLRAAIDSFVEKRAPARAVAVAPPAVVAVHDSSVSVELPGDWKARELDDRALLQLGAPDDTAWFVLTATPARATGLDLAGYAAKIRDEVLASWPNASAGEPRAATVPAGEALLTEIQWRDGHLPRVGVHVTVRGRDVWYELVGWTIPSLWETHRATFDHALQTLREAP